MGKNIEPSLHKKWLWGYFKKYWWIALVLFIFSLIDVAISLISPIPIKIITDSVFGSVPAPGFLEQFSGTKQLLVIMVAIVIMFGVIEEIYQFIQMNITARLRNRFDRALQNELLNAVLQVPISASEKLAVGDYVYRLDEQSESVSSIVFDAAVGITTSVILVLSVSVILFRANPLLSFITLGIVPLILIATRVFNKKIEKAAEEVEDEAEVLGGEVVQTVTIAKTIQSNSHEQASVGRIINRLRIFQKKTLGLANLGQLFDFTNDTLGAITRGLVILVGGFSVFNGTMTFGELLLFLAYVSQIIDPIQSLVTASTNIKEDMVSVRRVHEVVQSAQPVLAQAHNAKLQEKPKGELRFENITHTYRNELIFNNMSLTIPAGQKVGIVGKSGSGKSTLVNMPMRFVLPDRGFIYIDGHELSKMNLDDIRKNIAFVDQDTDITPGTVLDNIAFSRPNEPYALPDIMEAAAAAQIHNFIMMLPDGYNTDLGSVEDQLSGGQRQRLSLARAIYKNAPILILDEPTSAQDKGTEKALLKTLKTVFKDKTVVLVTHHIELLSLMDKVLLVEDGRLRPIEDVGGVEGLADYLSKDTDNEQKLGDIVITDASQLANDVPE